MDFIQELLQDAEFWVGIAFVAFVGILVWAYLPARKAEFAAAAELPFQSGQEPTQ